MPVWMPEAIHPGVTVSPPAPIPRAPPGAFMTPTAAIRPPRTTSVPRSIAGPDTGRIRAFVIATMSPVVGTALAAGAATGATGAADEGAGDWRTGRMPS